MHHQYIDNKGKSPLLGVHLMWNKIRDAASDALPIKAKLQAEDTALAVENTSEDTPSSWLNQQAHIRKHLIFKHVSKFEPTLNLLPTARKFTHDNDYP